MQANNDNKRFTSLYYVLVLLLVVAGIGAMYYAGSQMLTKRDYWEQVRQRLVQDSIPIMPERGDILSADGEILATSLPEYRICMDYVVVDTADTAAARRAQHWRDSVFKVQIDTICMGLHEIFPDKSQAEFKEHLLQGQKLRRRNWKVYPRRVTYIQYKACKELPLFRETAYKGGFYAEELKQRKKPYGSLAARTIGAMYAEKDTARFGVELSFDSLLRGTPGVKHVTKVRNRRLGFVDKEPIDGHDIMLTIDVRMQDVAEKALTAKLKELEAEWGVAVLMEVQTGDIKAIANIGRCDDGSYYEIQNYALGVRMEPGSTFKTASMMVALEDGKVKRDGMINTGNGTWPMHGRVMKDHNWHRGGYGEISIPEVLGYSSNVGISRIIDENYFDCPEKYVDGLYREGVGLPLDLPIVGAVNPVVRRPNQSRSNWSKTALAWMSIGYEVLLPPISTLTFYNAIANGGCMVKPRIIKAEMKDGKVIREFPTEVLKQRICSPSTLEDIQYMLEYVVSKGLGRKAGNKRFKVSGKTGTAQVANKSGGYKSNGKTAYMVSFCGYFPSDSPKYSCIVAIRKDGLPASGGGQCGPVFSAIAQTVMAQGVFREPYEGADTLSTFTPVVMDGSNSRTANVLQAIGQPGQRVAQPGDSCDINHVPNVRGMLARDAVKVLRQRGLKVCLHGAGLVAKQDIPHGAQAVRGNTITLQLEEEKVRIK